MNQITKLLSLLILVSGLFVSSPLWANGTPVVEDCKVAGYDKGFYIQSCDGDFKLKINIQLQPQYQFLKMEGQDDVNTFSIRRARLIFSGHAFVPELSYYFNFEAYGGRDSTTREADIQTGPNLRDAYFNYELTKGFQIRMGQWKPLFSREELNSSAKLQFISHTIANETFTLARDLGLWLHGEVMDGKLEWGVAATNEGVTRNTTNSNNEFLFTGRAVWNAAGKIGYTESDVGNSEDMQLALGLAGAYNKPAAAAGLNQDSIIAGTGDFILFYRGFSFMGAGYYARNTTDSQNLFGFLGQTGYFLIPKKLEVAGRFASVIPTSAGVPNGYEIGGGINYFFKGHNVKLQADYSMLLNSPLVFGGAAAATNIVTGDPFNGAGFVQDQTDHRIRTQVSLYF